MFYFICLTEFLCLTSYLFISIIKKKGPGAWEDGSVGKMAAGQVLRPDFRCSDFMQKVSVAFHIHNVNTGRGDLGSPKLSKL